MELEFKKIFNKWVAEKKAFVFLIDFEKKAPLIWTPSEAARQKVFFQLNGYTNFKKKYKKIPVRLKIFPPDKNKYQKAFEYVQHHLHAGNTYLLNLTFATRIKSNISLHDIFIQAAAPYKFYFKDKFVCFSPETFVQISDNIIKTFPMKGTIDARIPNARQKLLQNQKELNEHYTIVDLLRNDLAMVANKVRVKRFRYLEPVRTLNGELLQASSEIIGLLPDNWKKNNPATVFDKILPAGSISGAPKSKTIDIIKQAEIDNRGYYTGIFGYFDGNNFDTAVIIRYIEKNNNEFYYRSGGGITTLSNWKEEYNELIQKIYVPTD